MPVLESNGNSKTRASRCHMRSPPVQLSNDTENTFNTNHRQLTVLKCRKEMFSLNRKWGIWRTYWVTWIISQTHWLCFDKRLESPIPGPWNLAEEFQIFSVILIQSRQNIMKTYLWLWIYTRTEGVTNNNNFIFHTCPTSCIPFPFSLPKMYVSVGLRI